VRRTLATGEGFLEIVVDESLLEYPWELMSDGDSFLCLRHWVGRFVNAKAADALPTIGATNWNALAPGPLQVLLISVADPAARGGRKPERLHEAETETRAITDALTGAGVVLKTLQGPQATLAEVQRAFRGGYHIIHFNGHAEFNPDRPRESGLVLYDQNMKPGQIAPFLKASPPVLFFVNACESAATGTAVRGQHAFGLARAFLSTGAYLLGTRWRVEDVKAAKFAESFYKSLLAEKSIGESVRDARLACKDDADPGDFSWASYVYYGDPRVGFRKRS
jgi:CHAT domain-containing protein